VKGTSNDANASVSWTIVFQSSVFGEGEVGVHGFVVAGSSEGLTSVAMLPEPYATLVLLMEQTGLRIGEAIAGKRSDVKGNVIHVTRRIYRGDVGPLKTKKSYRTLLVSEDVKQPMLRISGSEWIFISDAGTPVCRQNGLSRYLRPACEKLGIEIGRLGTIFAIR
jgi:integrase